MGFRYTQPPLQGSNTNYWQQVQTPVPPYTTNDIENTNSATGGVVAGFKNGLNYALLIAVNGFLGLVRNISGGTMMEMSFEADNTTINRTSTANETGRVEIDDTDAGGNMKANVYVEDAAGNYSEASASTAEAAITSDHTVSGSDVVKVAARGADGAAVVTINGTDVFAIANGGEVWTNQTVAPVVLGTTNALMPIYDENGVFQGYAELKNPL